MMASESTEDVRRSHRKPRAMMVVFGVLNLVACLNALTIGVISIPRASAFQ